MDKNTLSEYGWVIIIIILLAAILAFLPMFNNMVIGGTNNYVDKFFGGSDDKLPKPSLTTKNKILVIKDGSGIAEEYEVNITGVGEEIISAEHPETEYDLSNLSYGIYRISVVSKATDKKDSSPSIITVNVGSVDTGTTEPTPGPGPEMGTLTKPSLSISESTLVIVKGSDETETYEVSINSITVGTLVAEVDTSYDLSYLSKQRHTISVVAKASGWNDSEAATIDFTPVYTQDDINKSNGKLVAIGKNNPLYVVAVFNDDFTSVTIVKNGADSDGIMKDFIATAGTSPFAEVCVMSPAYVDGDWYGLRNYLENEKHVRLYGENMKQEELPHPDYGLYAIDFNGDGVVDSNDSVELLYWLTNSPDASGTIYSETSITSAVIEDGVVNLGKDMFNGCYMLRTILIADSVTQIGTDAFNVTYYDYLDADLTEINFEATAAPNGFNVSGYPSSATIKYSVK